MFRRVVTLFMRFLRKPDPHQAHAASEAAPTIPAVAQAKRPPDLLLFAIRLGTCWLIAICFPLVDFFGAEAGTRAYSRDVYNLIMGTAFPPSLLPKADPPFAKPDPRRSQDPAKLVTVVLVDEETLDKYKLKDERTWPASARFYGQALQSILRYRPKAVFIDMMFLDELPGSFTPFDDAVQRYESAGVPLLIATPTETPDQPLESEPKPMPLPAQFAVAHSGDGLPGAKLLTENVHNLIKTLKMVEPVAAPVSLQAGIVHSYRLSGLLDGQARTPTAAVRLYELATERKLDLSGPSIELFWDLRLPDTNRRWLKCAMTGAPALENPIWRGLSALSGPGALKQTCGTVQTVPIAELFLPDTDCDARQMIEGKYVLFGADVIGGDSYSVPVIDRIAGVYIHAMALENLLAFGDRYIRTNLQIGSFLLDEKQIAWLFESPLIAFIVAYFAGYRRGENSHEDSSLLDKLLKALVHDARLGLITALAGFVLSIIFLATLSLAPLNWLGMGALAALTNEIRKWTKIEYRILAMLAPMRNNEAWQ